MFYSVQIFQFVSQEKEFLKMFHMPVIEVPTNLPNIRKDLPIQAFAVCFNNLLKCVLLVKKKVTNRCFC